VKSCENLTAAGCEILPVGGNEAPGTTYICLQNVGYTPKKKYGGYTQKKKYATNNKWD
jgi:hypothetical protein